MAMKPYHVGWIASLASLVFGILLYLVGTETLLVRIEVSQPKQRFVAADDGCRLSSDPASIQYKPWSSALGKSELSYFESVRTCLKHNFVWSLVAEDWILADSQKLICEHEINHEILLSVIEQHDNILFVGDSVIRQQYYALLCMIKPDLALDEMVSYSATDKFADIQWDYKRPDGRTTSLFYRIYGLGFDPSEQNLYKDAFPSAVRFFSERDAIVVDASRHYSESQAIFLARAVAFIARTHARARIYYVDPIPSEWPTSNGIFSASCKEAQCRCERLDEARLRGNGLLPSALVQATLAASNGIVPNVVLPPVLLDMYPELNQTTAGGGGDPKLCLPTCAPASWRSDIVRSALADAPHVTIVPLFWQLASQDTMTSRSVIGDCTHQRFSSLVLMNEQLIRSMLGLS